MFQVISIFYKYFKVKFNEVSLTYKIYNYIGLNTSIKVRIKQLYHFLI